MELSFSILSNTNQNEEEEALLNQSDHFILVKKIEDFQKAYFSSSGKTQWFRLSSEARCSWVNMDPTTAHFHSHVEYNRKEDGSEFSQTEHQHPLIQALRLPSRVILLREGAKQRFKWYKKRECERRRRYRMAREVYDIQRKRFQEKKHSITLEDLDMMKQYTMSILERCEFCGGFFLSINLFWGTTICDSCYFNPANIQSIMQKDEGKILSLHGVSAPKALEPSCLTSATTTSTSITITTESKKRSKKKSSIPATPPATPPTSSCFLPDEDDEDDITQPCGFSDKEIHERNEKDDFIFDWSAIAPAPTNAQIECMENITAFSMSGWNFTDVSLSSVSELPEPVSKKE